MSDSGRPSGVGDYDLATQTTTVCDRRDVWREVAGRQPPRRVFHEERHGARLLDTVTRKRTVVDVRLPAPASSTRCSPISPDNRTIYYGAARAEADIWIVERK